MTIKHRIAKLEQLAAGADSCGHNGIMTPEEWADAESRGFIGLDGRQMTGGVFVLSGVMTPEEWDVAAAEQQAALTSGLG